MKKINLKVSLVALIILIITMSSSIVYADTSLEECKESVVKIVSHDRTYWYQASGFAIGESGKPIEYIVTNYHVIEGMKEVFLYRGEDDLIELSVVFALPINDVAVMKLSDTLYNMEPLVLNIKERAKVGDDIFCLGFPGASNVLDDSGTGKSDDVMVTAGIIGKVSSLDSVEYYQIDATINPGNSGGPLIDKSGRVIGINSVSVTNADINGAILLEELVDALDSRGIKYEYWDGDDTKDAVNEEPTTEPVVTPEVTSEPNNSSDSVDNTLMITIIGAIAAVVIVVVVIVITKSKKTISNASVPTQMQKTVAGDSGKAILVGVDGNFSGKTYNIKGKMYMGRSSKCHVKYAVDYKGISNMHCSLSSNGREFTLMDIGSSYGTFLENGQKLEPNVAYTLRSGDKFYLADKKELFQVVVSD